MPFTLFAHQAFVLPLKLRWSNRFDATALCIGSMAPDFAYPLNEWLAKHSHTLVGLVWAFPFTVIATWLVRNRVAKTAFAHVPDFGPFRIHSLRSLGRRRPTRIATLVSALIGSVSHIGIDSFTHNESVGARWLGFHHHLVNFARHSVSAADLLQYTGHTIGSFIAVILLLRIGQRKLLEQWCGDQVVANDREFTLSRPQRAVFALIVGIGSAVGALWGWHSTEFFAFAIFDATAIATAAACLLPFCHPQNLKP